MFDGRGAAALVVLGLLVAGLSLYLGNQTGQPRTPRVELDASTQGFELASGKENEHASERSFVIAGRVPKLDWSGKKFVAKEIAAHRRPIVLQKTDMAAWPAVAKWADAAYLSEHLGKLPQVKESVNPVFVSGQVKDGQLPGVGVRDTAYRVRDGMTLDEFLRAEDDDGQDVYRHFQATIGTIGSQTLMDDLRPRKKLAMGSELAATTVWAASRAGVTSNTHYDRSNNFVTQVVGSKIWFLFPPPEWYRLYHFPTLHRHYHQSQIDVDAPDAAMFPNSTDATALMVTMHPGDVLYVPPYWTHRVQALDFAVSVSVVSPSEEELLYGEARFTPVPFDRDSWTVSEAMRQVRLFVTRLVARVLPDIPPAVFVRSILTNGRYRAIMDDLNAYARENTQKFAIIAGSSGCDENPNVSQDKIIQFDDAIREMGERFDRMPVGVREVNLGNLVEELSAEVGGPANVGIFLQKCFARDVKPKAPIHPTDEQMRIVKEAIDKRDRPSA